MDTNIENTHRELGILIEELLDDRNKWRDLAVRLLAANSKTLDVIDELRNLRYDNLSPEEMEALIAPKR